MESDRIRAEVSRAALRHNIRRAQSLAGKPLCAVVKADAYGHGAEEVARLCEEEGLRYLAVATAGEALRLRRAGIRMPLLVLSYAPPGAVPELAKAGVAVTVYDLGQARALSAALPQGMALRVHIKVDTGMNRLGLRSAEEVLAVCSLPGLQPEGLCTHFATADCPGDPFVKEQTAAFRRIYDILRENGVEFQIIHCENSGAVVNYKELPGTMVRVGLVLYGYPPDGRAPELWRPAMCLVASVLQVKRIEAGETVSYGRRHTAGKSSGIAVLSCGYADGYPRSLSGRASVLIHGRRAPVVGNICMDMMMADVSGLPPVRAGDKAVLFGQDGDAFLSLCELAEKAATIPYELLCSVSARVPRIYVP